MKKLLLFDIDGTLLIGGSMHDRFSHTINRIHGTDIVASKDFAGYTDFLILASLLEDEGWSDDQIKAAMPRLIDELDKVHEETFIPEATKLFPGVKGLLDKLRETDCVLGLITGNLETIAKRKLETVGIWDYFSIGAYGSDSHVTRGDLVATAIKRAGFERHIEDVFVIGDTPRDMEAAHAAGVTNSVGVANGLRSIDELHDAGAKFVFEDFKDTNQVIGSFGLIDASNT